MSVEPTIASAQLESRQSDTTETAPIAEGTQPESLSPKYVALAKQQRAMLQKQQALKTREDALKAREAEYSNDYVPKNKIKELIQKDPSNLGLTYEELANLILNQPGPEQAANQKLISRLDALENETKQTKSAFEEQQTKAYEQAVNQIRNDVKILVNSDENFETIKAKGAEEAVVELIEETFKAENRIMSNEEAAKEVEDYLVEEAFKDAQLKKVKARLNIPAEVPQEAPKQEMRRSQTITEKVHSEIPRAQQSIRTLTNSLGATSSKPLSERERIQRAMLAFKGQLK